jgi:hypothetical protein
MAWTTGEGTCLSLFYVIFLYVEYSSVCFQIFFFFLVALGFELKVSRLLGKLSTT